jgi:hypothetical protein
LAHFNRRISLFLCAVAGVTPSRAPLFAVRICRVRQVDERSGTLSGQKLTQGLSGYFDVLSRSARS